MLPTSLPGGSPAGITAARPTSPWAASAQARHARGLERRAAAELGKRDIGTTVGDEHHVLHGAHRTGGAESDGSNRTGHARHLARLPVTCSRASLVLVVAAVVSASYSPALQQRVGDQDHIARPGRRRARRRRPRATARLARPGGRRFRPRRRPRHARAGRVGSRQPDRARVAHARRPTCSWPSSRAASASSTRSATLSPTPVLTVGPLSRRQRARPARHHVLARRHEALRRLHRPDDNTHVDEYTMRGDVAVASTRRQSSFLQQPYPNHNGGEVITGPDGMLYIGLGDGGSEGDPQSQRPEPRHPARRRSCASIPTARRPAPPTPFPPTTRSSAGPGVGPRCGCGACATRGGSRSTARPATSGSATSARTSTRRSTSRRRAQKGINWGWSAREGFHAFQGLDTGRRTRSAARDSARRRQLRDRRRLRVPRARDPRARRRVRLRRRLPAEPRGRRRRPTDTSSRNATSDPIVSRAHDVRRGHDGELYAVRVGGTVFRIDRR